MLLPDPVFDDPHCAVLEQRVASMEEALYALIKSVEHQRQQLERLTAQIEEMILIAAHEEEKGV